MDIIIMGSKKNVLSPADFRHREKRPLYARLQEKLKGLIECGHWKPNDQLPTEREIAETTGISINTVKTALHNLVLEGYLHRRQGSGTFVNSPDSFFGLHRYYGMQENLGASLERHKKIFVSREKFLAPAECGKHFGQNEPIEVFKLERLLLVGGQKTIYTVSFLPVNLFPGFLSVTQAALEEHALYHILATKFNMPCRVSKELLSVRGTPAGVAKVLGIEADVPVLYSKLIALSYAQTPFEFRESYIITDKFQLYREF